ncbi:MAG: hypothetical protein JJ869_19700 [Marivita sp.]|uniref:hypothetical protein n=1 Tax=Marivita sp. TaxID=2003365 RepID=UPI001B2B6677|nr:hypothetical protein [Marivita sp.]MBO6885777.1 hypothetical protein [Marivita sp.]
MTEAIVPAHNLLVLSIGGSMESTLSIYEAARYAWKLDVNRARNVDYILAHRKGHIVGVFEADNWVAADHPEFEERFNENDSGRWGFIGKVAQPEILFQYFNKKLPEGFIKRGASNPVRFIHVSKPESPQEDPVLRDVEERIGSLGEFIEDALYRVPSTPEGFGGCTVIVGRNDSGELRVTFKLGTDNPQGLRKFNSADLIDDILDSEIEEEISRLLADLDLDAHDFEYLIETYTID